MSLFFGCNAVKRLKKNELLMTNDVFIINGEIDKSEDVKRLSFHKKNSSLLGLPLKLHVYNLARPNKDSIFNAWLTKSPKREQNYINILSKKQLDN